MHPMHWDSRMHKLSPGWTVGAPERLRVASWLAAAAKQLSPLQG